MRDRIPFKGRASRDAQAAAQKRAAQNERVSRAADAIKAAFERKRAGGDVTDCLGEPLRYNKPDPQTFAYTRGRPSVHGYGLQDFLHVAQSQYHDIAVAKRLGFEVCWIERRKGQEGSGATPVSRRSPPTDLRKSSPKIFSYM